jgi:general secretion pathway protein J
VAISPLDEWQVFFYRGDAWTNPQSADTSAQPPPTAPAPGSPMATRTSNLPDGVRVVLQLPAGRAISGRLLRDWVRPTVSIGRS